jgi:hypothetical protein
MDDKTKQEMEFYLLMNRLSRYGLRALIALLLLGFGVFVWALLG